mgnify:CR=1 FL=1
MEQLQIKNKGSEVFFKWIMFTAAITGMAIISAFYPIHANIPLVVIPSILVLIFAKPVFFEKLKLITLLTMRILNVFAAMMKSLYDMANCGAAAWARRRMIFHQLILPQSPG